MKDVQGWSHSQLDSYMDSNIEGFTVEQVGHMAWYLGVKHESMLREREMTMRQQDNMSDEPADEEIPEQ